MAQYDPLQLASYLRRARGEGFQPSFTDQDNAGPYDFDVRSDTEVGLGAHIDPVTGLPVGAEEALEPDPVAEVLASFDDVSKLTTVEATMDEITKTEAAYKDLVSKVIKREQDRVGVTQLNEQINQFRSFGAQDEHMEPLLRELDAKQRAVNSVLMLDNKGQLYGTKADQFRALDTRLSELDNQLVFQKKEEEKRFKAEERRLTREGRVADENAATRFAIAHKANITPSMMKGFSALNGREITKEDLSLMANDDKLKQFYSDWADGQRIVVDPIYITKYADGLKDTYLKALTVKEGPEVASKAQGIMDKLEQEAREAEVKADKLTYDDLNLKEKGAGTNIKDRGVALATKKQQLVTTAIEARKTVIKNSMLTPKKLIITPEMSTNSGETAASTLIQEIIQDRFPGQSLEDITSTSQGLAFISNNLPAIYAQSEMVSAVFPFQSIWIRMLDNMYTTFNAENSKYGLGLSAGDPTLSKLRNSVSLWNRLSTSNIRR